MYMSGRADEPRERLPVRGAHADVAGATDLAGHTLAFVEGSLAHETQLGVVRGGHIVGTRNDTQTTLVADPVAIARRRERITVSPDRVEDRFAIVCEKSDVEGEQGDGVHVSDPDLSVRAAEDDADPPSHYQHADVGPDKQSGKEDRHRLRIYCDFDGTIVREDVGDTFFSTFSGPEMWTDNASFMAGDITIDEVFTRYTDRMRGITPEHVDTWSAQFSVEPGFVDFVHWCAAQDYPLSIVSDGLDAYILPILRAASVDVPVYANRLVYREDGRCIVRRPWADEFCTRCGTCKRNRMLTLTPDEDIIVLIGDGFSDFCAAQYADIVFARDALETYCQRENISFRRFSSFDNIRAQLTALTDRKRIRKPRRAALTRADVWAGE